MHPRVLALIAIGIGLATPAIAEEPQAQPAKEQPAKAQPTEAPPAEPASDPARDIAEARRAVEDQRYDDALALLRPHVASPSRSTRASALEVTAIVRLLLGQTTEGREAVAALYALAPAFVLDDASLPPRVTSVFEAEAAMPHARAVTLAIRATTEERGVFEVTGGASASAIDLACSSTKPPVFTPIKVTKATAGHRFRLPTLAAHKCYAVARDTNGLPLGRLGSAARPVDVTPPPLPPAPSIATRWWFWAGIGVAVTAAVAGAAVASQTQTGPPPADIIIHPQHVVLSW